MRILSFPTKNNRHSAPKTADWSQQEIADFYRAHRLLAENGAAIGIDRGLSDIGEPWLVFFDQSSQDVFLHVARIDGRCHLICDSLSLRISAANIAALILEFEAAVRTSLSIRTERAKNVIIHPAARIIMSISAIFLLFKLENSEAQAKVMADKASNPGDASGPTRLIDKSGVAFARAQNAFARAFDNADAPANAALLAGVILAGELATVLDPSKSSAPEAEKTIILPHIEEAPLQQSEGSEQHKMNVYQADKEVHIQPTQRAQPLTEVFQAEKNETKVAYGSTQFQQVVLKQAPIVRAQETEQHSTVSPKALNQDIVVKVSEAVARTSEPEADASTLSSSNGLKALSEGVVKTGGILIGDVKTPAAIGPAIVPEEKIKTVISLDTLSGLVGKVGFNLTTNYDDVKSYAIKEQLTKQMGGQFTFEYQTNGKLLIEQVGVEDLKPNEIGVWTNVISDHSSTSIVGKVGIIDDVLTLFN